eukprot:UN13963
MAVPILPAVKIAKTVKIDDFHRVPSLQIAKTVKIDDFHALPLFKIAKTVKLMIFIWYTVPLNNGRKR